MRSTTQEGFSHVDHAGAGSALGPVLSGLPFVERADVAASHSGHPRFCQECHNVADVAGHDLDARVRAIPAPRRLDLRRHGRATRPG